MAIAEQGGVYQGEKAVKRAEKAWKLTHDELKRMFSYIACIPPHAVRNLISIANSRRIIIYLDQALTDVLDAIAANI